MQKSLIGGLTWVLVTSSVLCMGQAKQISSSEAKDHIGEKLTVCGKVVSIRTSKYKIADKGQPLVLTFDQPDPNAVFQVLTWPSDASKRDEMQASYQGKQVCATGKIIKARGVPHMIAADPATQIQIEDKQDKEAKP